MIIYSVKFAMNKGTKNQKWDISHHLNDYILYEICYDQRHKESKFRYFTLSLNDYILYEICYEQRHKESEMRYFTLSLNDYLLCEICYEQRHKESTHIYFI